MSEETADMFYFILQILKDAKGRFLELGDALETLRTEQPDAFATLTESSLLSRRRAYYFIKISKAFAGREPFHERLRALGWTKAAALAGHAGNDDFEELLQLAETVTAYELKMFLKKGPKALGGGIMAFAFSPAQFAIVRSLLKLHGAYDMPKGLCDKEKALMRALAKIMKI